jgi:RNA ligase (TIGR02306 family)
MDKPDTSNRLKSSPLTAEQSYAAGQTPDSTLAEIVRISSVEDITNAEFIQQYTVKGWKCVAKKNEFKQNDLAIYVKIGSILDPSNSLFVFLEGKPLKTKKIRGALSQGLIGPLSWLPNSEFKEGEDVTVALKIKKYVESDEAASLGGTAGRPSFIPRTDADRVQNLSISDWNKLWDKQFYASRKEDGTSTTYYYKDGQFGITSRNCSINPSDTARSVFHYVEMARQFRVEEKMKKLRRNIAIQGEIVGPGINGNRLKLTALDFRVFGVWNIDEGRYLVQQPRPGFYDGKITFKPI